MKFISSIILLVALQMFSAKKYFPGGFSGCGGCGSFLPVFVDPTQNNIANINNCANSSANSLAVNAGVFGDANSNAFSAATNVNNVNQGGYGIC